MHTYAILILLVTVLFSEAVNHSERKFGHTFFLAPSPRFLGNFILCVIMETLGSENFNFDRNVEMYLL